jgi:DNA mismatch repair ATPase MutL
MKTTLFLLLQEKRNAGNYLNSLSNSDIKFNPAIDRAKSYASQLASRPEPNSGKVDLENIWQVHSKYIVSPITSGLVIIDQHVAHERVLFEEISKFVQQYNNLPTQTSLEIELQNRKDLNGEDYGKVVSILKNFNIDNDSNTDSPDFDWLVDTTEKFCKDKAIYNAIVEGINIIDGKD